MIGILIGFLPAAIGMMLMRAPGSSPGVCRHDLHRLLIGCGIGIGLCSEMYFLGLVAGYPGTALEAVMLGLLCAAAARHRVAERCRFCEAAQGTEQKRRPIVTLGGVLCCLLIADVTLFWWVGLRHPIGGWDAWAIWNLRARFLFRTSGAAWRDGFTKDLFWTHPDYPLLIPAFVARGWSLLGRETTVVPFVLAGFFTFGSLGLMATSVSILRGLQQGLLASIAMAAAPFFYVQGAMQCADVPVAFFRLATLASFAMADRLDSRGLAAIAGVAAALDGWTKNEGLLWLLAFLLARLMVAGGRLLPAFLGGALPVLAPVLLFKLRVAGSSDIFGAAEPAALIGRLLDPGRYELIAGELLHRAWEFGPLVPGALPILATYLAVTGLRPEPRDRALIRTGALALLFTAAGYFGIYLIHPLDVKWLLDTSSDRLLLQLWPGIVFVVFLTARAPGFRQRATREIPPRAL